MNRIYNKELDELMGLCVLQMWSPHLQHTLRDGCDGLVTYSPLA